MLNLPEPHEVSLGHGRTYLNLQTYLIPKKLALNAGTIVLMIIGISGPSICFQSQDLHFF